MKSPTPPRPHLCPRAASGRWLAAFAAAPLLAACAGAPSEAAPLPDPETASAAGTQAPAAGTQAPAAGTPAPAAGTQPAPAKTAAAEVAARTPKQVTGIAASKGGRIFLNFPRWVDEPTPSVAELGADGALKPYPNEAWNAWDKKPGPSAKKSFVCVQSVFVDASDTLWILDPASPAFGGVVPGGAKLLRMNLAKNEVERVYLFDDAAAPKQSYLNDVRVAQGHAFITDSGLGAVVVLNLANGKARRLLAGHPSTRAEPGVAPVIGGKPWRGDKDAVPEVHSDGIAIHPKGDYLYYHALTGRTLYRVPIAALLDASLSAEALGGRVERVTATQPTDGMEFDAQGNLYLTALEDSAIQVLRPDGKLEILARSDEFAWPDSIAITGAGDLLFTTAQIHRMPAFNGGKDLRQPPFQVFRLKLP